MLNLANGTRLLMVRRPYFAARMSAEGDKNIWIIHLDLGAATLRLLLNFDQVQNNWVPCLFLSSSVFLCLIFSYPIQESIYRRKVQELLIVQKLDVLLADCIQMFPLTLVQKEFNMNVIGMNSCDRITMHTKSMLKSMSWFFVLNAV